MVRSRCLFISLIAVCLILSLTSGCSHKKQQSENKKQTTQSTATEEKSQASQASTNDEQEKESEMTSKESSSSEPKEVTPKKTRKVTIYFVDDASAEIIGEEFEVENKYDIWNTLKEQGVLRKDCKLLNMTLNKEDKRIDLDFNKATGDYIRSMGTTGETQIIACIVNTYLEAYECKEIKLTEEGNVFQTAHGSDFEGYTERINDL